MSDRAFLGGTVLSLRPVDTPNTPQPVPPHTSLTNFDDVPVIASVPIVAPLRTQSENALREALSDLSKAEELASTYGVSAQRVQRDAAILISRAEAGPMVAGQVVSETQFAREAALLGQKIEELPAVYRLDSRTPEEVLAAGGFLPNSGKPPSTLWEHTARGADGGGSYVSTSTVQANPGTLLNSDFWDGSRMVSGTDPRRAGIYNQPQANFEDLAFRRYEYRITNSNGVVLSGAAYADEAEAVIRSAGVQQIEYREITVHQRWQTKVEVDPSDGFTTYEYSLKPMRNIDPVNDVQTGGWIKLSKT